MEDKECAKMFIHMEQYVPHLEKFISESKNPKKKNRELWLNKLEALYSIITDKKKKLKLDTLRKCEDVILKILHKVNPNIVGQLKPFIPLNESPMLKICELKEQIMVEPAHDQNYFDSLKFQAAQARLNVISTPASLSPPKDSIPLVHLPFVIPTDRNIAHLKDPRSPNRRVADPRNAMHAVGDPRSAGHAVGDHRATGHPTADITNNIHYDVYKVESEVRKPEEEKPVAHTEPEVIKPFSSDPKLRIQVTEEGKAEEEYSFDESDDEDKIKPKKITRQLSNTRSTKKLRKNKKRKIEDLNSSFEDNVVETVRKKTKGHRRLTKTADGKPRKYRTELDMLHEDIKQMFIRDEVLAANGKRICTMLKGDKSDSEGVLSTLAKQNTRSRICYKEDTSDDENKLDLSKTTTTTALDESKGSEEWKASEDESKASEEVSVNDSEIILMDQLGLRGTRRFSCSLCDFKHQHQTCVRSHMKVRHKVTSVSVNPVVPHLTNYYEDCFIMKPKFIGTSVASKDSIASNVLQDFSQNNSTRVMFGPDQIDQLPIRSIFNQNIVCSVCGYESKVRSNLVRHLQFHLRNKEVAVPVLAPVNPVLCLDKKFDKTTNLAHSSFSNKSRMSEPSVKREMSYITKEEESNFPKFVPSAKRYVCGAYNCQYLNQEESILRDHVQTFHSDETSYMCLHCNESLTIDKLVIKVENILHHTKLHDLNLYKCKYCSFLHYKKQKIEAHVTEKHLSDRLHIVVVREMEQEPQNSPQVEEVKEKKPWRCGICKYCCTTKNEIVSHVFNKHEVENQYNCAMCSFKSNERNVFETHFLVNHVGHCVDVNSTYYEDMDSPLAMKPTETEVFDTTPLLQRDRNKFKHIRGIPLEERIGLDELNVDVIELEDDESLLQLPKNSLEEKDPFTIIYNGKETIKELTIKDIEEMDLNMIKLGEFSCESGKFGKPANKEYFCPICENFKAKRVIEFTQHLYKDLDYYRFMCARCGLPNSSRKVLEKHFMEKHLMSSLEILTLPPDIKLEQYVKKLLAYQQRVMFADGDQPETVERKRESNAYGEFKNLEKYCGDLKKHETSHWAVKPYKCTICSFEGVTSTEVIQHSRRIHVNCPPDVITVQLPENPKSIPISRKRRYPHDVESDASSDTFEFNESSSDIVLPDNPDGDHGNDDIVYVCH